MKMRGRGQPKKRREDRRDFAMHGYVEQWLGKKFVLRCSELCISRSDLLRILVKREVESGPKDKVHYV